MLKKSGLIAAASVASLVAVGPLAHAGGTGDVDAHRVGGAGTGHDRDHGHGAGHHHGNQNSHGPVNVGNGNNVTVPMQVCNNDVQGQVGAVPVQDVAENPTFTPNGALALLGGAESEQTSDSANTRACGQDSAAGYGNH